VAQEHEADLYPSLPMAREYRHLANLMTDVLTEKVPEAAGHKEEIISFIFSRMSVRRFERQIMSDTEKLDNKTTDNDSPCSSTAYRQEPARCEALCRNMAMMVISQSHNIYTRKYLKPDALTKSLFARSSDTDTDLIISWIEKKVSQSEFREKSGSTFTIESEDQIYSYRSSPFSWKLMFGREGYAVFRDGKLVNNAVVRMN
jgi:hypothetical protein